MNNILFFKMTIKNFLIVLFLSFSIIAQSNSSFPVEFPENTNTTIQKKNNKKQRKGIKRLRKLKSKYGTVSVLLVLLGVICMLSVYLTVVGAILLFIISPLAAWYGTKKDENPKRAKRMFTFYLILFGLLLLSVGWSVLVGVFF